MKRIFTFFMVACSSAAMMAQTLSVGTTVSDVYDGNTIAYKITAVDDESMTATAELITSGTDLGSAEKNADHFGILCVSRLYRYSKLYGV